MLVIGSIFHIWVIGDLITVFIIFNDFIAVLRLVKLLAFVMFHILCISVFKIWKNLCHIFNIYKSADIGDGRGLVRE